MAFTGAFREHMDFRLAALGPTDATIKLVRVIKLKPPGGE
jgi:hypothetical protein